MLLRYLEKLEWLANIKALKIPSPFEKSKELVIGKAETIGIMDRYLARVVSRVRKEFGQAGGTRHTLLDITREGEHSP
jgi:hypothetical protein